MNRIFTTPWQEEIKKEDAQKKLNASYRELFGSETFDKIKSFKDYIYKHPQSSAILAFLNQKQS
jgi:hypothetical protein